MRPALELSIALVDAGGTVRRRVRLCWPAVPVARAVLDEVAGRALAARRDGLVLLVDQAPADVRLLLALAGLS